MRKETIESVLNEKITGSIYGTGKITTESGKQYFLKTGMRSLSFRCEANGLKEIAKAEAIRRPEIISVGEDYLLTEYIEASRPSGDFFGKLGKQVALLHKHQAKFFGFYENNFIGANPQMNIATDEEKSNWSAFYFNKRLLFQYKSAERNGYVTPSMRANFSKIENRIDSIIGANAEPPCLLHGDLWGGNYICDLSANPVLIDPAVYYGHREADLAMTKVFGGFDSRFYQSYQKEYPLAEGWEYRENIYKLYHILNHLNLFGRSYLPEAEFIIHSYST